MSDELIAAAALLIYQAVLVAIGLASRRGLQDDLGFHLGGRKLGAWVAAISTAASSSSAWTLLGVSAAAYRFGLGAIWLFPGCVMGFALNWYLIAPRLSRAARGSDAVTLTGFLAGPARRGAFVRLASAVILASFAVYVSQQFNAAGKAFSASFDWDPSFSIVIGAAVVLAYTALGGFTAVCRTDLFQGLLMLLVALLLPTLALWRVGGFGPLIEHLQTAPHSDLFRGARGPAALGLVLGILGIGLGYPGQPHVVNRFMALREGQSVLVHAKRIGVLWAVLLYAGMLIAGWCGRLLLPGLADPETLLFALSEHLLPSFFQGLVVAAILSAVMSTADSQLLVGASALSCDLGIQRRLFGRWPVDRVVIGLFAVGGVGLALIGPREIFDMTLLAWGLLSATFGPGLVWTLWRSPPGARALAVSAAVGALSTAVAFALGHRSDAVLLVVPLAFALLTLALLAERGRSAAPRH